MYVYVNVLNMDFSFTSTVYILLVVHMISPLFSSDSERLQKLFNFTISCTLQLNGIKLECMVDGPTAVLPFNTTCQINDQPPEKYKLSKCISRPHYILGCRPHNRNSHYVS